MTYQLTSVRWFHSGMADAPVLRGEAGALIELLDACLINGFCTRSLNSLVVSGGVAMATISAGNPYERHAVIRVAGASITALNGDHRVDTAGASTFTFLAPGVPDGAASGTMTVIRSPAGWSKPFSGTNKAAYQGDENSTQLYLRVDDSEALYSNVRGYENLTDIDAGVGLFPTEAQQANYWWTKSNAASTTRREWVLVADGAMLWFVSAWHSTYPLLGVMHHFGDGAAFSPADAYMCMISGAAGAKSAGAPWSGTPPAAQINSFQRYFARPSDASPGPVTVGLMSQLVYNSGNFLWGAAGVPSTDTGGGCQIGAPLLAYNGPVANTTKLRGVFPGLRPVLQLNPFTLTAGGIVAPVQESGGGLFLPVSVDVTSQASQAALDILGPWR